MSAKKITLRVNENTSTNITHAELIELNSYGLLERNSKNEIHYDPLAEKKTVRLLRPELQCRGFSARYGDYLASLKPDDPVRVLLLAEMRRGSGQKTTARPGWVSNAVRPMRHEVTVDPYERTEDAA